MILVTVTTFLFVEVCWIRSLTKQPLAWTLKVWLRYVKKPDGLSTFGTLSILKHTRAIKFGQADATKAACYKTAVVRSFVTFFLTID